MFEQQASRRLGDKNEALYTPRTAAERGSCKRLSVFSCFGTHLSKVHRRSNTDLQRQSVFEVDSLEENPFPEQTFIAA